MQPDPDIGLGPFRNQINHSIPFFFINPFLGITLRQTEVSHVNASIFGPHHTLST